jgi:hypothetical protein
MPSHRTGTIGNKSGTPIPRLPHFQGFVEQEGKGRDEHTCSLPEKDMMKTWASEGDIGSILLDIYRDRAHKRRKKPSGERSSAGAAPKLEHTSVSPRRARECECLPSPGLYSICRLLPRMILGCPIFQTWTPCRQNNLSVAGVTVSSSVARTKKGQEQVRFARTHVDECWSTCGCDCGRGHQVGEEEQGEGREDELDVRRRRK